MKKNALLFFLLCLSISAYADIIDVETAKKAAISFFSSIPERHTDPPGMPQAEETIAERAGNTDLLFVFNFHGGGYVIVAADDAAYPILGYSGTEHYDPMHLPCCFRAWIDRYKSQVLFLKENNITATSRISTAWNHLLNNEHSDGTTRAWATTGPWTDHIIWGQEFPYNAKCPYDATLQDPALYYHCATGCGATAMGIIMMWWRHPTQGQDTYTYADPKYGNQTANFGTTTYEWMSMTFDIQEECDAAAQLLYHAAVSLKSTFGNETSGLWIRMRTALTSYFRFSSDMEQISPADPRFEDKLRNDLYDIPVLFAAKTAEGSGHMWVCDGFRFDNALPPDEWIYYYHMNWGWGGQLNDGYFQLGAFNPNGYEFNTDLVALIKITPADDADHYSCTGQEELSGSFGSVEDGSGPPHGLNGQYNYSAGKDCQWLIKPDDAVEMITLNFHDLQLDQNDRVSIYDGETTASAVLWSGSQDPPASVSSTGDKMLVHFTSQANSPGGFGFLSSYTSTPIPYCSDEAEPVGLGGSTNQMTVKSNNVPDKNYRNNTSCKWEYFTVQQGLIKFTFNFFDVADLNDVLDVTDEGTLNIRLTKDNWSQYQTIQTTSQDFKLTFSTDCMKRGTGWEGVITFTPQGDIEELNSLGLARIFPNPAAGEFTLDLTPKHPGLFVISLFSMTGEEMFSKPEHIESTHFRSSYNVSSIPPGIYFLKIKGKEGIIAKKVVVM